MAQYNYTASSMLSLVQVTAVATLLLAMSPVALAKQTEVSITQYQKYRTDATELLQDLDQYQALWIKAHGCVWSECAVDDNDDDGENRDGDEQWYQYRTQQFCANAAFSLYGIPKNHVSVNHCSRGNYINSFFTYGGADTLLNALGKSYDIYYDDDGYASNADCSVVQNDDDYGVSSTMGCSADGKFTMANFGGQACDGNHFLESVDNLNAYNRQVNHVNCHKIWGRSFGSTTMADSLLSSSWTCDIDLYPNGCPDPYGIKQRQANALRAVSHGKSGSMAVWNGRLKRPLRIISWMCFLMGIALVVFSYRLQNKERIESKGGGLTGWVRVLMDDLRAQRSKRKMNRSSSSSKKRRSSKKKKRRKSTSKNKKSSKKDRKHSKRRHDDDYEEDDDHSVDIELANTRSTEDNESGVMT